MEKRELESRMDRIIEWVKTCDTKASIMLSVLSISVGILFTSDFVTSALQKIIYNTFVVSDKGSFSWSAFIALSCAIFAVIALLLALCFYVKVLKAKVRENQTGENHLMTHSYIHFHHVSKLTYDEFVYGLEHSDIEKDLMSQIYINAKRCAEKFADYNVGVRWTVISFTSAIGMILFMLIYVSCFNIL